MAAKILVIFCEFQTTNNIQYFVYFANEMYVAIIYPSYRRILDKCTFIDYFHRLRALS